MLLSGNYLVALLAVTSLVPVAMAVTCYQCGGGLGGCDDPFSSAGVDTCDGDYCIKTKAEAIGITVVSRSCGVGTSDNSCTSNSIAGTSSDVCSCNTDNCNSAPTSGAGYFLLPVAIIVMWCMM